jgi:hypothetical protein
MTRITVLVACFTFAPSIVWAHGEGVVFAPFGQSAALIVVGILLWRLPFRGIAIRCITAVCAVGIAASLWYVDLSWLPYLMLFNAVGFFLIGFVPPVLIAYAIFRLQLSFIKRNKNA